MSLSSSVVPTPFNNMIRAQYDSPGEIGWVSRIQKKLIYKAKGGGISWAARNLKVACQ